MQEIKTGMTELLLIRHGETDWNAEKRLQGHIDIPLNAAGWRQAILLALALANEKPDAIIASDLLRACQTAQEIATVHDMPVFTDVELRERCYGAFEGMRHDEISRRYPDAYAAWKARDIDMRFPGGARQAETLREFSTRVVGAISRLMQRKKYRKVVMVAHGGVLECAYRAAQGMGFGHSRDFDIFNASINRFLWVDGQLQLVEWGDIAHLSAESLQNEMDK